MNYQHAISTALNGKKIQQRDWKVDHFWYFNKDKVLVNSINQPVILKERHFNMDNWEIYKEGKIFEYGDFKIEITDNGEIIISMLGDAIYISRNKSERFKLLEQAIKYAKGISK